MLGALLHRLKRLVSSHATEDSLFSIDTLNKICLLKKVYTKNMREEYIRGTSASSNALGVNPTCNKRYCIRHK